MPNLTGSAQDRASRPDTIRPMQPTKRAGSLKSTTTGGSRLPASRLEAWAGPVTDERLQRVVRNRDDEIRLIAELDGVPVGIGALVVANSELRACYLPPSAAPLGVATAIIAEIERIAREHGVRELHLESSVTAEPFYATLGYSVEKRGELAIAPGVVMAAVTMRKRLE